MPSGRPRPNCRPDQSRSRTIAPCEWGGLLESKVTRFKIYYEVTATTVGAKLFYFPIRKGRPCACGLRKPTPLRSAMGPVDVLLKARRRIGTGPARDGTAPK